MSVDCSQHMTPLACLEKKDLVSAYQVATQKYSDAVASLDHNMGICAKDRYDAFYRLAEEARLVTHTARERLDKHIAEHAC